MCSVLLQNANSIVWSYARRTLPDRGNTIRDIWGYMHTVKYLNNALTGKMSSSQQFAIMYEAHHSRSSEGFAGKSCTSWYASQIRIFVSYHPSLTSENFKHIFLPFCSRVVEQSAIWSTSRCSSRHFFIYFKLTGLWSFRSAVATNAWSVTRSVTQSLKLSNVESG